MRSSISITIFDKTVASAIAKALEPAMMTVKVLSQRDCNLLKARAALKLMLLQISRQNNKFARMLVRQLCDRIIYRWEVAAGELYCLQQGSYFDSFPNFCARTNVSEDDSDVDFFVDYEEDEYVMTEQEILRIFDIPPSKDVKKFIISLLQRLCASEIPTMCEETQNSVADVTHRTSSERSFEDILAEEVSKADAELADSLPNESALAKIRANEMAMLEKNKTRGVFLDRVYNMLITIKPSSVESERAFSSAGLVCTKIRSRLRDESLDSLCFLRAFFNNPASRSMQYD